MKLRHLLLLLLYAGFIGTIAELLLSRHTEDFWQLVPLVLLGLGLVLTCITAMRPHSRAAVRTLQALMLLFIASSAVGTFLHYRAKTGFALERDSSLRGLDLFRQALKGTTPPLLAPGAMAMLGLLGLAWAYSSVARRPPSTEHSQTTGDEPR